MEETRNGHKILTMERLGSRHIKVTKGNDDRIILRWIWTKTKLHGLNRANYTDRATAACQRDEFTTAVISVLKTGRWIWTQWNSFWIAFSGGPWHAVLNLQVLRTDDYADWSGTQTGRQELYCCCKGDWPVLEKSRQLLQSFPTSHCVAMSLLNTNHST
jgi:hypothetical protein